MQRSGLSSASRRSTLQGEGWTLTYMYLYDERECWLHRGLNPDYQARRQGENTRNHASIDPVQHARNRDKISLRLALQRGRMGSRRALWSLVQCRIAGFGSLRIRMLLYGNVCKTLEKLPGSWAYSFFTSCMSSISCYFLSLDATSRVSPMLPPLLSPRLPVSRVSLFSTASYSLLLTSP
ncbi:hypothetical protein V8C44DRAFT_322045 [Trichoderma aethiopicum]